MAERSYEWSDPAELADAVRTLPFLEVLQRLIDGRLPPPSMMATLGMDVIEAGEGRAVFAGTPPAYALNPMGQLHGGWYATLLDSALGCAIQSTLPAGQGQTTLEFKINLVRAAKIGEGPVRCEARMRHVGRRTGTAEGDIYSPDGKLLAHGSTTCLILQF